MMQQAPISPVRRPPRIGVVSSPRSAIKFPNSPKKNDVTANMTPITTSPPPIQQVSIHQPQDDSSTTLEKKASSPKLPVFHARPIKAPSIAISKEDDGDEDSVPAKNKNNDEDDDYDNDEEEDDEEDDNDDDEDEKSHRNRKHSPKKPGSKLSSIFSLVKKKPHEREKQSRMKRRSVAGKNKHQDSSRSNNESQQDSNTEENEEKNKNAIASSEDDADLTDEDDDEEEDDNDLYEQELANKAFKEQVHKGIPVPLPYRASTYFWSLSGLIALICVILFWCFASAPVTAYSFVILFAVSLCYLLVIIWVWIKIIKPDHDNFIKIWYNTEQYSHEVRMNKLIPMMRSLIWLVLGLIMVLIFLWLVLAITIPNIVIQVELISLISQLSKTNEAQFILFFIFNVVAIIICVVFILSVAIASIRCTNALEANTYKTIRQRIMNNNNNNNNVDNHVNTSNPDNAIIKPDVVVHDKKSDVVQDEKKTN